MKTLITYLFICMSLFTLKAQTSPADNGCINFDEFNICYSVEYRPEDEKVGTICSIGLGYAPQGAVRQTLLFIDFKLLRLYWIDL